MNWGHQHQQLTWSENRSAFKQDACQRVFLTLTIFSLLLMFSSWSIILYKSQLHIRWKRLWRDQQRSVLVFYVYLCVHNSLAFSIQSFQTVTHTLTCSKSSLDSSDLGQQIFIWETYLTQLSFAHFAVKCVDDMTGDYAAFFDGLFWDECA